MQKERIPRILFTAKVAGAFIAPRMKRSQFPSISSFVSSLFPSSFQSRDDASDLSVSPTSCRHPTIACTFQRSHLEKSFDLMEKGITLNFVRTNRRRLTTTPRSTNPRSSSRPRGNVWTPAGRANKVERREKKNMATDRRR